MIQSRPARPVCIILSFLIAAPFGFAQAPAAAPAAPPPPVANQASGPLTIGILEGDKAVNSLPLLRSVAPVIEVRDQNDFPVEGATVVFTVPAQGPGGTFAGGGTSFTARSDARGQAAAPPIIPRQAGKFEIGVSAALGARKGEAVITQTNSTQAHFGADIAQQRHWYKNKWFWIAAGGGVAVIATVILVTRGGGSSGNTVTVTPGPPVFQ